LKPALRTFLDERVKPSSLLAWGIQLPDRQTESACISNSLQSAQVGRAFHQILATADELSARQLTAHRLLWRFDQLTIYLTLRPDQHALCVIQPRQEGGGVSAESLLTDFLALNLAD